MVIWNEIMPIVKIKGMVDPKMNLLPLMFFQTYCIRLWLIRETCILSIESSGNQNLKDLKRSERQPKMKQFNPNHVKRYDRLYDERN